MPTMYLMLMMLYLVTRETLQCSFRKVYNGDDDFYSSCTAISTVRPSLIENCISQAYGLNANVFNFNASKQECQLRQCASTNNTDLMLVSVAANQGTDIYILWCDEACRSYLGMEDGSILDSQLSGAPAYPACDLEHCRLNFAEAVECTAYASNDKSNCFVQVDLKESKRISGFIVQIRDQIVVSDYQYVTQIQFELSDDASTWIKASVKGNELIDTHLSVTVKEATFYIDTPMNARYVKLTGLQFHSHCSFRFEILGCEARPKICGTMGMENGDIGDEQLTSTTAKPGCEAKYSRYNSYGSPTGCAAFAPLYDNAISWVEVDFLSVAEVQMITIQRRGDVDEFILSFYAWYSLNRNVWNRAVSVNGELHQVNMNIYVYQDVPITKVHARYIRINPQTWDVWPSFRFELYGCYEVLELPQTTVMTTKEPTTTEPLTTLETTEATTTTLPDTTTEQVTTSAVETSTQLQTTTYEDTTTTSNATTVGTTIRSTTSEDATTSAPEQMSTIVEKVVTTPVPEPVTESGVDPLRCPEITSVNNGVVVEEEENKLLTVVCDVGFSYGDGSEMRSFMCGNDGQWQPDIAGCTSNTCGYETNVTTTSVNQPIIVSETCSSGVMVTGLITMYSQCSSTGQMDKLNFNCFDAGCKPPAFIGNTTASYVDTNSYVAYYCIPGYKFPDGSKRQVIECRQGQWKPEIIPACEAEVCPSINITDASLNTTLAVFGTYVQISCTVGFNLADGNTSKVIVCQDGGAWNDSATWACQKIICPAIPDVANGVLTQKAISYFGEQASLVCNNGLRTLEGNDDVDMTCTSTGRWSYDINTLSCEAQRCQPVPTVFRGTPGSLVASVGSKVNITCLQGFVYPDGMADKQTECGTDLQWTDVPEECEVAKCPPPPSVAHSTQFGSSYSYGSIVNYTCNTGYEFTADAVHRDIQCVGTGQWSVNMASQTCNAIKCPYAPVIGNATMKNSSIEYLAEVVYTCQAGYMMDGQLHSQNSVCQADNTWSPIVANCTVLECPQIPVWLNIEVNSTSVQYLSTVQYWCAVDYVFEGDNITDTKTTTCGGLAEWDPPIVLCKFALKSHNNYVPVESENADDIGTIAVALASTIILCMIIMDIVTLPRDLVHFRRNIRDMKWNFKHRFPKRIKPPPSKKKKKRSQKQSTGPRLGLFRTVQTVSRPVYYRNTKVQKVVEPKDIEERPLTAETPSPPSSSPPMVPLLENLPMDSPGQSCHSLDTVNTVVSARSVRPTYYTPRKPPSDAVIMKDVD